MASKAGVEGFIMDSGSDVLYLLPGGLRVVQGHHQGVDPGSFFLALADNLRESQLMPKDKVVSFLSCVKIGVCLYLN